jgi:hypothetical protein
MNKKNNEIRTKCHVSNCCNTEMKYIVNKKYGFCSSRYGRSGYHHATKVQCENGYCILGNGANCVL